MLETNEEETFSYSSISIIEIQTIFINKIVENSAIKKYTLIPCLTFKGSVKALLMIPICLI